MSLQKELATSVAVSNQRWGHRQASSGAWHWQRHVTSTASTARCGPACRVVWEGPGPSGPAPIPIGGRYDCLLTGSGRLLPTQSGRRRLYIARRRADVCAAEQQDSMSTSNARRAWLWTTVMLGGCSRLASRPQIAAPVRDGRCAHRWILVDQRQSAQPA